MNFKESYKLGIKSAVDIEQKRAEIAGVFLELRQDIYEVTNGEIEVILVADSFASFMKSDDKNRYKDICCRRVFGDNKKSKPIKLASFITSSDGAYPCNIIFDEDDITIFDKNSLIHELSKIISSPNAGVIFRSLLDDNLTHPPQQLVKKRRI